MDRNIELVRYRQFGDDLLLFELVNSPTYNASRPSAQRSSKATPHQMPNDIKEASDVRVSTSKDRTYAEWQQLLSPEMKSLLDSAEEYIVSLGDDVQRKELKLYVAFKRLKNFASIVPQKAKLLLFLSVNPDLVQPLPPNARDGRTFGHWGTGDLELSITSIADFEAAKSLLMLAYEGLSR
jgi:predicted transport protein